MREVRLSRAVMTMISARVVDRRPDRRDNRAFQPARQKLVRFGDQCIQVHAHSLPPHRRGRVAGIRHGRDRERGGGQCMQ